MVQDFLKQTGSLALGSRLRRMSDRIMREGALIYKMHGIEFEPKWFPIFYMLRQHAPLGITDVSSALGLSHPAIILSVKEMEEKGLIVSLQDPRDKRKRLLDLTPRAREMAGKMESLWQDIRSAADQTLSQHGIPMLEALQKLEAAFDQQSFFSRVQQATSQRKNEEVTIIDYAPELAPHFKRLNEAWIARYFEIEEADLKVLGNPQGYILDKGGFIIFARCGQEIVGTCALIREEGNRFELAKMAVDEQYQGKQIGKKLGLGAISKALEAGAESLYLVSNTSLAPAINLYRRLGFYEVPLENSLYKRTNIKMELDRQKF